jgi:Protein of unknown function (DUF3313)
LCASLLLGACAQTPDRVEKEQFSGFLGTYSSLKKYEDDLGPAWRWLSPKLTDGIASAKYNSVYVDDIGYYPAPRSNEAVSSKTLIEIARYFTKNVRAAIGSEMKLLDKPANGAVRMQIAITGVSADADVLKGYKYNPVSRVFGDKSVKIYIEIKVTDASTGELLGLAVREGFGDVKANKSKTLTLNGVKGLLDKWSLHIKNVTAQMKSAGRK